MSIDHFVGNDPKTPDIAFEGVPVKFKSLGGHVVGRTNIIVKLLHALVAIDCEPEVC
jgi:hypothetical protein